jgi:septation ring formation regulator EzrA
LKCHVQGYTRTKPNAGRQDGSQVNDIELEDACSKKQMHEEPKQMHSEMHSELKQREVALITSSWIRQNLDHLEKRDKHVSTQESTSLAESTRLKTSSRSISMYLRNIVTGFRNASGK